MSWDHSIYVRGRRKKRDKIREIAASLAPTWECKLVDVDPDDDYDEDDESFDLGFEFANRGGGFTVERLDGGYHLYTDNVLAGSADVNDIGDLMAAVGGKLGTLLDDADEIEELLGDGETEDANRPLLDATIRNKAVVRIEDRSGVTLGKLTLDAAEILAAIDPDGKLRDLAAYPKLTEAGRASARAARVQVTLHDDYRAYRRYRWSCDREGKITDAKVEELSD